MDETLPGTRRGLQFKLTLDGILGVSGAISVRVHAVQIDSQDLEELSLPTLSELRTICHMPSAICPYF